MQIKLIHPHGCYTDLIGLSSTAVYAICKAYGDERYTESELVDMVPTWNYITCCRYTGRVSLCMEPPDGCPWELTPVEVLREILDITSIY